MSWPPFHRTQTPAITHQTQTPATNVQAPRLELLPIKCLTHMEMAARREKGLCFNCDTKFTPGHRCKQAQFLCLMVEQEDSSSSEDPPTELQPTSAVDALETQGLLDVPCISFHALTGQVVPSTLKIAGSVHGKDVIVLVDGGLTNNFVQKQLANHLGLVIQPLPDLRVTMGNGEAVSSTRACAVEQDHFYCRLDFIADLWGEYCTRVAMVALIRTYCI